MKTTKGVYTSGQQSRVVRRTITKGEVTCTEVNKTDRREHGGGSAVKVRREKKGAERTKPRHKVEGETAKKGKQRENGLCKKN